MFHAEAYKFWRMGDGAIPYSRIADRQDSHLSWHPIEVLHTLRDGVVGQDPSKCRRDGDLRRRLRRQRRAARV